VLQGVAGCCSVLRRVAVCCSVLSVLQCVQMRTPSPKSENDEERTRKTLSSVCCSVLQRVAACCIVLHRVAGRAERKHSLRVETIQNAQDRHNVRLCGVFRFI